MAKLTVQDIRDLYNSISPSNRALPSTEQADFELKWLMTELLYREMKGLDTDTSPDAGEDLDDRFQEIRDLIASLASVYDREGHYRGTPEGDEIIWYGVNARRISYPLNFSGSVAKCIVAPTAETVFKLYRNEVEVGTITFAEGVRTATFSSIGVFTLAAGDVFSIQAPTTPDATIEHIIWSLKGTWSD